jgi:hypothetical protein
MKKMRNSAARNKNQSNTGADWPWQDKASGQFMMFTFVTIIVRKRTVSQNKNSNLLFIL